jgi:hypothetical protein
MSNGVPQTSDALEAHPMSYGNYGEIFNKGWQALNHDPFPGPWPQPSTCFFPRNQLPSPPATQPSVRPALITRQHALILYGRPCDRSHCLVDFNGIFYKVGACFPFALLLFLGFVYNTLVSSHQPFAPSSAPIDCLATNRDPW